MRRLAVLALVAIVGYLLGASKGYEIGFLDAYADDTLGVYPDDLEDEGNGL